MSISLRVILVLISVLNLLNIIRKIRKFKLQIEYAIFWVLFSVLLIVLALIPEISIYLAEWIGVRSPVNMVFLVVIFVLLLKTFYMTLEISQLQYKLQELVQRLALQDYKTNSEDGVKKKDVI